MLYLIKIYWLIFVFSFCLHHKYIWEPVKISSDSDNIKLCYFTDITCHGERKNLPNLKQYLSPVLIPKTAFSRTDLRRTNSPDSRRLSAARAEKCVKKRNEGFPSIVR